MYYERWKSHLVPKPVAESPDVGDAHGAEVLGVVAEEHEEVGGLTRLAKSEEAYVTYAGVGGPVLVQVRRRLAQNLKIIMKSLEKSYQQ